MHLINTTSEKVLLNLLGQVLSMCGISQVQTILVDDHRLHTYPLLPGFLGHFLVNPLAKFPRIRRKIKRFGLTTEFDTGNHSCHEIDSVMR